uniref:Si:ch211-113e8.11 n=1 Tax=Nothobranchius kuhntae TaxID=321403 RepID=A0A1A8J770_NOTKU
MNSLVNYGASSDSEEEVEDVDFRTTCSPEDLGDDAVTKKTRNFLLESGSASSDSDPDDPEPSSSSPHQQTPLSSALVFPPPSLGPPTPIKLPSPSLNASSGSSVFTNPFKAQAEQKLSALQKHVPLTMQARPSQIGGKKVCVSYRKNGRCRFGIKCKFAHDSDLQTPATASDTHPGVNEDTPSAHSGGGGALNTKQEPKRSEQQQTKKRVGLSNTLIPPKRALKQYTMQRERERINTTDKSASPAAH